MDQKRDHKPPKSPGVVVTNRHESLRSGALRYEAKAVAEAGEGTRNNRLNLAAWKLSRLIAPGALTREAIESELGDAALTAGLGEQEIRATLKTPSKPACVIPGEVQNSASGPHSSIVRIFLDLDSVPLDDHLNVIPKHIEDVLIGELAENQS